MEKREILKIVSWLFILIALLLAIWKLLGHSPSDTSILAVFTSALFLKMWDISREVSDIKHKLDKFEGNLKR